MKKSIEFKDFKEAREKGLSLEEIKKITKKGSQELRSEVSQQVIDALYDGGIIIKLGRAGKREELDYLKALTSRGNRIKRLDNKEANLIHPGDLIQITINQNTKEKEIRKNGKKIGIAIEGFERSSKKSPKEEKVENKTEKKPEPKIIPQETKTPNIEKEPEAKTEDQAQVLVTPNTETETKPNFVPITSSSIPTTEKAKSSTEKSSSGKLLGYSKDGKNYFIGEKGESKLIEFTDYTTEYKDKLELFDVLLKRIENFRLIYNAIISKNPNDEKLKNNFKKLNNVIENFNDQDFDNSMKKINNIMINSLKDLKNKEKIDLSNETSVLEYIRKELRDYDLVSLHIVEKKFSEFTKIKNEDYEIFIQNPSSENESSKKIEGILGEDYNKIIQKLNEKEKDAKNYYNNFREKIKKERPEISNAELEKYRKQIIDTFMYGYGKDLIFNNFLEKKYGNEYSYNGNDKDIKLYSDIHGIGRLDIKDKTLDWGQETLILIGTELLAIAAGSVTLGAGAYLVNSLVYGTRGVRFLKGMYETGNVANKTLKGASFLEKGAILSSRSGRFITTAGIEGTSFYGGYGAAQSIIEGKNTYSMEGLAESVFYVGALKGLTGVYKSLGKEILPNIPLREQKLKLVSQIGLEGAVLSAPGLYKQGVLFEPGEWNAETIVSAFALAAAFKGAGIKLDRIRFKQGQNGQVIAETITSKTETYIHTKTGKRYTKLEDGSFINENGRPVPKNFKTEYLIKEEIKATEAKESNGTEIKAEGNENKNINELEKIYKNKLNKFNSKLRKDLENLKIGEKIKVDSIEITKQGPNEFTINQDTRIKKLWEVINEIPEKTKLNQIKKSTLESIYNVKVGEEFRFGNKRVGRDEKGLFIRIKNEDGSTDLIRDIGKIKEILEGPESFKLENSTKVETKDSESADTNNSQRDSGSETKPETKSEGKENINEAYKISKKNLKRFNDKLRSDLIDLKIGEKIEIDSIKITKQGKNEFTVNQETKIKKLGEVMNEIPEIAKVNQIKKLTLESLNEIKVGESFNFENKILGKDEGGLFIKVKNKDGSTDLIRDMGKIKEILENSNIENDLFKNLFYKDVFKKYPELFKNITDKVGEKLFKGLEIADKKIEGVRVLGELHKFLKWSLYKNAGSKKLWNSVGTPFVSVSEIVNGFRTGGFGEGSKRLAKGISFGDTKISVKEGLLKITIYGTSLKLAEELYEYAKNPQVYTFDISNDIDKVREEIQEKGYFSYGKDKILNIDKKDVLDIYMRIWGGVVNNLALDYLTYKNENKDKDFDDE